MTKGDFFHAKEGVDVHLGLDVECLPDLQEVLKGDPLVYLIGFYLPHAHAGHLLRGPICRGMRSPLLGVGPSGEELLNHFTF